MRLAASTTATTASPGKVVSHQAVEIITVSFDDEADVSQEALAVKQCAGLPAAIWQHRDGGEPEMELFFAEAAKRFTLTA